MEGIQVDPDETLPIKSIDTSFTVIELVMELDGARLSDLTSLLGLPKSTVSDHLVSLLRRGYLVKNGAEYNVGLKFLELGDHARHYRNIYEQSKAKIDDLAERTGELVHLSVEENGRGVIVYEREGRQAVALDTYVGRRVPMHSTALGKAMLAYLAEDRRSEIIDEHGLPPQTDRTITSEAVLAEHLDGVRERGYALSNGERVEELSCIAVPIRNREVVHGAISVCCPTTRIEDERFEEEIPHMVRQAANRIELDIRYE